MLFKQDVMDTHLYKGVKKALFDKLFPVGHKAKVTAVIDRSWTEAYSAQVRHIQMTTMALNLFEIDLMNDDEGVEFVIKSLGPKFNVRSLLFANVHGNEIYAPKDSLLSEKINDQPIGHNDILALAIMVLLELYVENAKYLF